MKVRRPASWLSYLFASVALGAASAAYGGVAMHDRSLSLGWFLAGAATCAVFLLVGLHQYDLYRAERRREARRATRDAHRRDEAAIRLSTRLQRRVEDAEAGARWLAAQDTMVIPTQARVVSSTVYVLPHPADDAAKMRLMADFELRTEDIRI